jgi:hypothetical protein
MLDAGGGGGMPSMIGFKQAATSGSFAVNESGGKALLQAIKDMATWVNGSMADLSSLSRQQPLGSSNGAELMKPYLQNVASDDQGFITQLQQFKATLADFEAGVIAAMANYDSSDGASEGSFRAV